MAKIVLRYTLKRLLYSIIGFRYQHPVRRNTMEQPLQIAGVPVEGQWIKIVGGTDVFLLEIRSDGSFSESRITAMDTAWEGQAEISGENQLSTHVGPFTTTFAPERTGRFFVGQETNSEDIGYQKEVMIAKLAL